MAHRKGGSVLSLRGQELGLAAGVPAVVRPDVTVGDTDRPRICSAHAPSPAASTRLPAIDSTAIKARGVQKLIRAPKCPQGGLKGARHPHERSAFLVGERDSPRHLLPENPVLHTQVPVLECELPTQQPGHGRDHRQPNLIQFSFDGLLHRRCLSAQGHAREERIPRDGMH
jgi:hypothetical protein